jgi:hypothetical protein
MPAQPPDPWRAVVDATEAAATERAAHPELAARLEVAATPFRTGGTEVSGLLDEVDRRAVIDVDAPLESSRPVVPQLKGAVRKSVAFVSRHLAQQTTVLVSGLSAAVRRLDQRVQRLEAVAHRSVLASAPDVRSDVASVLEELERGGDGPRRDVGTAAELATLPPTGAALVVAYRLVDVGSLAERLGVLDALLAGVAPGGRLALVTVDAARWPDLAGPVLTDLGAPGPLHPQTWAHLMEERGGSDVEVHDGTGARVISARW